jgi:HD-like signal output (HDOD) protein
VQELATLIGKDLVVTAKVIAAANTIGYNPAGVPVTTITEAIHVIGFNKIRQLAVSLLLMESANRSLNAKEKREIAALALCSGLMAEAVMGQRQTGAPEHAFICASLRNYGRLLMTSFMIEDYRRAKIMATTGMAEDEAFKNVFGLTPLELGHHLLASAHLPEAILKSLRSLPIGVVKSALHQPEVELLALADLSVRVCELALRSDVGAEEFAREAQAIAGRTGKLFDLDSDGILGVLRDTGRQLYEFAHTFGLNSLADQFAPRINARLTGDDPAGFSPPGGSNSPIVPGEPLSEEEIQRLGPASHEAVPADESSNTRTAATARPAGASGQAPTAPGESVKPTLPPANPASVPATGAPVAELKPTPEKPTPAEPPPPVTEAAFQNAFQNGIEQIAGLLEDDPVDMRKVYSVVLRTAQQGFGTQDCIIFARDSSSRRYPASFGSGALFNVVQRHSGAKEDDRDVFGLCLQRLEDVLIYDAADPKIVPHLPAWLKAGQLGSFVLLPIQENRRPFAVLLAGWNHKRTAGFTVAQIRHVRSMLKLAGTAKKLAEAR